MKILIVDYVLYAGALLAQRLSKDGHEVVYAPVWGPKADSPFVDALGRGLSGVTIAPDAWMNWIKWADVATVTGSEHKGNPTAYMRQQGTPVCGPGRWSVMLELNRSYGHKIFAEMGLAPSKSMRFTDPEEAVRYVQKRPDRYVVKLDQTARAVAETYVGQEPTGKDVVDHLRFLNSKLRFADGAVGVYLDELIPGVEAGIGGWFNGKEIVGNLMVNYEGAGGYLYDFTVPADRFLDQARVQAVLAKYKYRGPFDINGFITPDKKYRPIEWTPRWGGGTTEFFCYAADDLAGLLHACATGGQVKLLKDRLKNRIGLVVNARDETEEPVPRDIILPKGATLPYFHDEDSSFWVMWPSRSKDGGWLSLPVFEEHERRIGMYVTAGDNLAAALEKAEKLEGVASIADASFEAGRARDDLEPRMEKGRKFALGEAWINKLAYDTKLAWGNPFI